MTKKQIEKALPEGYYISKAMGVWYFSGEDTINWPESCTNFCTLDQGEIEDWVERFEYCKELYEERI